MGHPTLVWSTVRVWAGQRLLSSERMGTRGGFAQVEAAGRAFSISPYRE
ncbi:hypothetical protein [Streptomyces sp. NPDC005017]